MSRIIFPSLGDTLSTATGESVVPFYLQETIGGSDIDNQPSLRAFKDYRFRGTDLLTVKAEYDRKMCEACKPGIIPTVCTHLGLLLAYDAGQVALHRSDFDISQMRQSFGDGVSIYLSKDVIFRMAVAFWGAGKERIRISAWGILSSGYVVVALCRLV